MRKMPSCQFLLASMLIFCQITASCQDVDSSFIQSTDNKCLLGLLTAYRNFEITAKGGFKGTARFKNASFGPGARIKYGKASFSFVVPVRRNYIDPNLKQTNYKLSVNRRTNHYWLESSIRFSKGFELYLEDQQEMDFEKNMRMWNGNVAVLFPLNKDKFSLRSSFKFRDIQLQSKGSFLLGSSLNYLNIQIDADDDDGFEIEEDKELDLYKNISVGAAAGYGYTFIHKSIFVTGVGMGGLDLRRLTLRHEAGKDHYLRVNPNFNFRFAAGYNTQRFFAGIYAESQFELVNQKVVGTQEKTNSIGITAGIRIDPPRFLRRTHRMIDKVL